MSPRDWLLAFIVAAPDRAVDPLRLQKGLFLLAMREVIPPPERYAFEPYAYGPMSRQLYADLRGLTRDGLVVDVPLAGAGWRAARPTDAARACLPAISPDVWGELRALRHLVDSLTFAELLDAVYAEFPDYAVNWVFRRR